MKKTAVVLLFVVGALLCTSAQSNAGAEKEVLALEHRAMDGWVSGNPEPSLSVADENITYFHVMTNGRLEGLPALKALYERYRGVSLYDSYEIVNPQVIAAGDTALLTYVLEWRKGQRAEQWNATQVYQRKKGAWKLIHSHWSKTSAAQ